MTIILDYTSAISPTALKAANVEGVCRYLAWIDVSRWKMISKGEYDELRAAGIDVYLNWENRHDDWLGGSAKGTQHATEAVRQARALGYPRGSVIIGSCDFDITRTQWTANGRAYARAFAAGVTGGGYRPAVYGPWDVIQWVDEEGIMDAFWQAGMSTAWSNGRNANPHPMAHIRQRGHKTVGGKDTDWNEIRRRPVFGGAAMSDPGVALNLGTWNVLARLAIRVGGIINGDEVLEYELKNADGTVTKIREENALLKQIAVHDSRVSQVESDIANVKEMLGQILTLLSNGVPGGSMPTEFTGTFSAKVGNPT